MNYLISSLTDRMSSTSNDSSSSLRVPCLISDDSVLVEPPIPRLVGVELNPGPGPKKKQELALVKYTAPRAAKAPNLASLALPKSRRRRRPAGLVTLRKTSGGIQLAQSWAKLLSNPFMNTPEPLGLGCMVPTSTFTFYKRGVIDSNADGSLSIALVPTPFIGVGTAKPILYNTGTVNTATWSSLDFQNAAAFTTAYGSSCEVRTLAAGIRLIPSIAATTAPGELYAGEFPAAGWGAVGSMTHAAIQTSPFVESGSGYDGATVCTRPQDFDSFVFYAPADLTSSSSFTWSIPVISAAFAAVATRCYYEVILHVEVLPSSTALIAPGATGQANADSISNDFPSFESMFRYTNKLLSGATKLTSHFVDVIDNVGTIARAVGGPGGMKGSYRLTPGSALPRIMS